MGDPSLGPFAAAKPSRRRWVITFTVIAALLAAFSLIAFWGLTQSDWLYGTYGRISQAQWDQMADLRDQLLQLGGASDAAAALSGALVLPHPSTEDALLSLRRAALALDRFEANPTACEIQAQIYALIAQIEPGYKPRPTRWSTPTPVPTPTLTPIYAAPVARGDKEFSCL